MSSLSDRARSSVVQCSESDLPELRRFQASQFGSRAPWLSSSDIAWLHSNNPFGSSSGLGIWISRRDGQIVGQQAELAFGLNVNGKTVRAIVPTELMVDPRWRLHGLGPALSDTLCRATRVACSFLMTDDALKMYMRTGWEEIGEIPRYVLPLRSDALPYSGPLGSVAGAAMTMSRALLRSASRVRVSGTRLEEIPAFDERADLIWRRNLGSYPVMARRASVDLEWRFDTGRHARLYRRFYLLRGSVPVGYLVVRDRPWRGTNALRVVDYLAEPRLVGALMTHAVLLASRSGHALIEVTTQNRRAARAIRSTGLWPSKPTPRPRFMLHCSPDDDLRGTLSSFDNWLITSADGDEEIATRALLLAQ